MFNNTQKTQLGRIVPIATIGGAIGATGGLIANRHLINRSITPEENIEYENLANQFNDAYNKYNKSGNIGFITKKGTGDILADNYIDASQKFIDEDARLSQKYGNPYIVPAAALGGAGIAGAITAKKLGMFSNYDPLIEAGSTGLLGLNGLTLPTAISNVVNTRQKQKLANELQQLQEVGTGLTSDIDLQRKNILKNINLASTIGTGAGLGIGYLGRRPTKKEEYSYYHYMADFSVPPELIAGGELGLGAWIAGSRLNKARNLNTAKQLLQEEIEAEKLKNSSLLAQKGLEKLVGNKFILPISVVGSVYGGKLIGDKLRPEESTFSRYSKAVYGDSKKSRDWTKRKKYNQLYKDRGLTLG